LTFRRAFLVGGAALAAWLLFFQGLTDAGVLNVDEPRYASIGREMWGSADWVSPRLWGEVWLEKPPLLYWLVGLGHATGLHGEAAPRGPVALLSVVFLVFYNRFLARQFGSLEAHFATAILATSAGWLAFSRLAVTDLPLAVTFSSAMLLAMPWAVHGDRRWLPVAGAFFGLAVLAKGLVPLALALPLLWWGGRRWKDLLLPVAIGLTVALPWYWLCYTRHGRELVDVLIIQQHFARFLSGEQLHAQPVWFYAPVLIGGLFPWTPLLVFLFRKDLYTDVRLRYLLVWAGFGLIFFSAASGKLPGYLMPLMPAIAALIGVALPRVRRWDWLLITPAILIALVVPVLIELLPAALQQGLSRTSLPLAWSPWMLTVLIPFSFFWLDRTRRFACTAGFVVVVLACALPRALESLEERASARALRLPASWCLGNIHRNWEYGLRYYYPAVSRCDFANPQPQLEQGADGRPQLRR